MTDTPRATGRLTPIALGAVAGASAWLSTGVLAVTDAGAVRRVGALPGLAWLAAVAALGAAVAWGTRMRAAQAWPLALLGLLWLPWLPFSVPPVFLLWEGPLEVFVWAAALGGVAWACRPWPAAPAWSPRRSAGVAATIALAAYLTGAWGIADVTPAGDEPHYLIIAQSLLADGDLQIENNHRQRDYESYSGRELKPDFLRRGVNGQIYSVHAPGLPALVAPAFALFGHPGVVGFLALLVAAGTGAAWLAAFRFTGSAAAAWVGWAGIALSTPVFFHAFTVYPDGAGAAMTMLGVLALVALDRGDRPATGAIAGVGSALALLPWLHTRFALVAGVLGVALVLRLWRGAGGLPRVAALLAVPVLSGVAWFGTFYAIYGTPNPAAPYGGYTQSALAYLQPGLPGILFDQQFGFVANAPVYLAACAGLAAVWARSRRLAVELACLAVPYVLAVASYRMWWGGFSAPGRFAVAVLLPMVVPLAAGWATWSGAFRAGISVLLALSLGITGALALARDGQLLYNGRDGYALLLDAASRSVNLPVAFPSLHRDVPLDAVQDIALWLALALIALGSLALLERRPASPGVRWLRTTALTAAAVMLGVTMVAGGAASVMLTPSTSQMALIERWTPAGAPLAVQVDGWRRIPVDALPQRLRLGTTVRGPRSTPAPLLLIPRVPAGEYELVFEAASRPEGTLQATVGHTTQTLAEWSLADRRAGGSGLVLRLPTMVHSLVVRGDDAARRTVRRVTLHPLRLPASDERHQVAVAAQGLGRAQLFFLDENAWVETGGVWLRGRATARLVAQPADGASPGEVRLLVRGGAVPNRVTFTAGGWRETIALLPGEETSIALPAAAQAPAVLEVRADEGFRPHDVDPTSGDVRLLGLWVGPR